ncbi:MAG: RNase adapter RapZ [Candidatus Eremiobacteraeota bacterium]|nr:RNase adapter RapZ [Candidatus Eremiobacteraeota bacterium]
MTFHRLVFVTGLSGAGKSQAMKTFEDLGFYCVDNLPPALAARTLALLDDGQISRIAVSMDVRTGGPLGEATAVLDELAAGGTSLELLFFDAHDETLIRRYSETRRRHPFASQGTLTDAIATERATLAPLRERSTQVIDTTALTHADLKNKLTAAYAPMASEHRLSVVIVAFGFKYGIPLDLDLLFDVRFLKNPNYVAGLKELTGADQPVGAFIQTDPAWAPFRVKLYDMMDFLIPRYLAEGKSQLTVGIACTGGRHRSVFIARELYNHLRTNQSLDLHLDSRDTTR